MAHELAAEPADLALLAVALAQPAALLGRVDDDQLASPTPCAGWTLSDLVDHVVNAPAQFAATMRGEEPDWSAPPPRIGSDRVARLRATSEQLLAAWQAAEEAPVPMDWQLAELAVHTWALATALGEPTDGLEAGVAERGLSFMRANLRPEIRGEAFGPEQPAPAGADAYATIAAFAGRTV